MRASPPSASAACLDCGGGYMGRVLFVKNRIDGLTKCFLNCPACGPAPIDPERLRRWSVDVCGCLDALAAAASMRGPVREVVDGRLWFVGHAAWAGRSVEVYFARQAVGPHRVAVRAALAKHPRAVVLVPTRENADRAWSDCTNVVAALDETSALLDGRLVFDATMVVSQIGTSAAKPKKSPAKRGERAADIEKLTRSMIAHLRAARDHANFTLENGGKAELLPCPTQRELARLNQMSESAVSRCMKDKRAVQLRLLMEVASDVYQIMRWPVK